MDMPGLLPVCLYTSMYTYIYIYIYVCTYFIYLCVCFCSVINIATSDDTLNEVAAAYLREFP